MRRPRGLGIVRRWWQSFTGAERPRVVILKYHRVTDVACDPWGLCVSPENFAEQLNVLCEYNNVIPLSQVSEVLQNRRRQPGIAITFDDGYSDNLLEAKPRLEQSHLPATIFMTSGEVGRTREFWWDELEKVFLLPGELPGELHLKIHGHEHHWALGDGAVLTRAQFEEHRKWRADFDESPTIRHRLYRSIYDLLQGMERESREEAMDELARWSGISTAVRPTHHALGEAEVCVLAEGNWIEIGAHTVTHQALATQTPEVQRAEIAGSKARLEEIVGRPVESFSYPYGMHTDETVRIVRECGFARSCACMDQVAKRNSNLFCLPRMMVEDWSGNEFEARLQCWLKS